MLGHSRCPDKHHAGASTPSNNDARAEHRATMPWDHHPPLGVNGTHLADQVDDVAIRQGEVYNRDVDMRRPAAPGGRRARLGNNRQAYGVD